MTRRARPRCYVASPLGFTEAGRDYYRAILLPALTAVVDPVDPWAFVGAREIEAARVAGELRAMWLGIGHRNAEAIQNSDLLVAVLDGQEVDSGTAAELGYAAALKKCCFGLRTDMREAGEDGVAVNLQVETFVETSGGSISRSLSDLIVALRKFLAA